MVTSASAPARAGSRAGPCRAGGNAAPVGKGQGRPIGLGQVEHQLGRKADPRGQGCVGGMDAEDRVTSLHRGTGGNALQCADTVAGHGDRQDLTAVGAQGEGNLTFCGGGVHIVDLARGKGGQHLAFGHDAGRDGQRHHIAARIGQRHCCDHQTRRQCQHGRRSEKPRAKARTRRGRAGLWPRAAKGCGVDAQDLTHRHQIARDPAVQQVAQLRQVIAGRVGEDQDRPAPRSAP